MLLRSHQIVLGVLPAVVRVGAARQSDFSCVAKGRKCTQGSSSLPILGDVPIVDRQGVSGSAVAQESDGGGGWGTRRNNWMALVRYTEAGFLDIDNNNVAEREMKRIKKLLVERTGCSSARRKERDGGGDDELHPRRATRLDVEPWAYLHDVLTQPLPTTPSGGLDALLPDRAGRGREQRAKPAAVSPTPPEKSNAGKASPT